MCVVTFIFYFSGFWGIICVGLFSKTCLIKELYEDLCFCVSSDLPSSVCRTPKYILGVNFISLVFSLRICVIINQINKIVLFYPMNKC